MSRRVVHLLAAALLLLVVWACRDEPEVADTIALEPTTAAAPAVESDDRDEVRHEIRVEDDDDDRAEVRVRERREDDGGEVRVEKRVRERDGRVEVEEKREVKRDKSGPGDR